MPASRIAAFTAAATFSTMAGRPMSSGKSSALIAVPIASRDCDGGPDFAFLANTVACGVMTPSQPPDQTIGMSAISASLRRPRLASTRRNAWSARMRVKSLTPPLPSVLPMTAITSSAANCAGVDALLQPGGILHGLELDLRDLDRHACCLLPSLRHARRAFAAQHLLVAGAAVDHGRSGAAASMAQLVAQSSPWQLRRRTRRPGEVSASTTP